MSLANVWRPVSRVASLANVAILGAAAATTYPAGRHLPRFPPPSRILRNDIVDGYRIFQDERKNRKEMRRAKPSLSSK